MSCRHISVLFRKDTLTLKRNWSFLCFFVLLPMIMMSGFTYIHDQLVGKFVPEQHNFKRKSNFHINTIIKPTLQLNVLCFFRFNVDKGECRLALLHVVRHAKQPTELA